MNFNSKKIIFIIVLQCFAICIHAQVSKVPDGILFQAIAKDPAGNPAKGRTIYIKNAIIQNSISGVQVYLESHKIVASNEGVFTIVIGKGNKLSGPASISNIDWSSGPYFLNIKAAIAPSVPLTNWNVDEHYIDMGTSQFWTVPFALFAARVEGFDLKLNIADTAFMLSQRIGKDTISLSNRLNAKLSITDTALMLSNRIARDTILLSERISSKVSIADTSVMLSSRFARDTAALSNRINLKLNIVDTTLMLSKRFARDTAALSNRINLKLNAADTAAMLTNYLASIHSKENSIHKSVDTSLGGLTPSNILFPTQLAVKKYIENNAASISSGSGGTVSNHPSRIHP